MAVHLELRLAPVTESLDERNAAATWAVQPLRPDHQRSIDVTRTPTRPRRSSDRRSCLVRVAGELGQMRLAQPQAGR
jgi:hypothetical protein